MTQTNDNVLMMQFFESGEKVCFISMLSSKPTGEPNGMAAFTSVSYAAYLWIYFFFITSSAILSCGADKNREKVHVAKRQELKNRQRDAMLAGKPVQTVIEEVEPLMQRSTSRISCVRELPDFQALDKLRPKQAISLEKIEPPNFNTMTMESNQSKVMIELSELHDIAGSSSNGTPVMKCHGLNDDTTTAIPLDEDEFHDISLSD
ncbi:hypothetical protein GCK32_016520 [Trichostrongylus colubriformis]|uniref:Uncharacterized protein n=1 Tax=Trichostrongylus colubriformis TaxID=6319 RepID=A0AAN8J1W6_TRICO